MCRIDKQRRWGLDSLCRTDKQRRWGLDSLCRTDKQRRWGLDSLCRTDKQRRWGLESLCRTDKQRRWGLESLCRTDKQRRWGLDSLCRTDKQRSKLALKRRHMNTTTKTRLVYCNCHPAKDSVKCSCAYIIMRLPKFKCMRVSNRLLCFEIRQRSIRSSLALQNSPEEYQIALQA